jgi:hypothetical protein
VTDPNGSRAAALADALGQLPSSSQVQVVAFQGSTTAFLAGGLAGFVPLASLAPADRTMLQTQLLNFSAPGTGTRDWVRTLNDLYALIYTDAQQALIAGQPKADYHVVFVTDSRPTVNQDDQLLCGDSVTRIHQLRLYAGEVRFHTVHVFLPAQTPTCTVDAGILAGGSSCLVPTTQNPGCATVEVELDAERLRRMALLGAGQFRDVRSGAVSFLGLFP